MRTAKLHNGASFTMGEQLLDLHRCPNCSVANPLLVKCWASSGVVMPNPAKDAYHWGAYVCTTCNNLVIVSGYALDREFAVRTCTPNPKYAHEDIPEIARKFLQQAFETLHAPDAATLMAGAAVDAMLKALGYTENSLYQRIDQALKDNVITASMAEWAHSVRLGANRPRHADKDAPHVSEAEAEQAVEFAEALGHFLFVLSARIHRGIEASHAAVK